ncbi:pyrimidine operon attenuation protein / uracil phosphoribosyltransferase [Tenacibaculum sp. MAR_2009_124]|uniref:phosphoribosyltransferase domain-containing protein n=1 Tax=Tenacibaculum sp. MAR_2009_124 TaxID=1250059 RepID=UPI0008976C64|nr:phosphoribosyltransferase domain-containing protein [Tenacibaculum sp. MAR_2009_124]SEB47667.1 pyrimidine operon attenuation protein / uracil phosphoribosyltransferase [Tenacibaculum sp. MAR_2009_124]
MIAQNNIILNNIQIEQKIKRIAYQVYETNNTEKEIVIAGISKNGYILAQKLAKVFAEISPTEIILCEVFIDKKNPINSVSTSIEQHEYENKALVLVDDVLNSGTTLIYAIKHFLDVPLKKFKTAVLVDRNHKKYPVKADFKGISLSTSIKEHVNVEFKNEQTIAYLI